MTVLQDPIIIALILLLSSYILGSVNFSILLFRILGKEDPRKGFSGNPGATNVYRQAGLLWAVVVLIMDIGRAVVIAMGAVIFLEIDIIPWTGLFLIIGNRYPCFHSFKGGKGVANYLGFSVVLVPWAALMSGLSWLVVKVVMKAPFIASFAMVSILATGTILKFKSAPIAVTGTVLTALLIFLAHKKNIRDYLLKPKQNGTS